MFVFNDISIGFNLLCALFRRTRILYECIVVPCIVLLESFNLFALVILKIILSAYVSVTIIS